MKLKLFTAGFLLPLALAAYVLTRLSPAAGPGAGADRIAARRRAMVARLPKTGIALLVLGGSHDLGPLLGAEVLHVRVTPRGYPR